MYKVLIFAGTVEGRLVAEYLAAANIPVLASVATAYGAQLLEQSFDQLSEQTSCQHSKQHLHQHSEQYSPPHPDLQITQGRLDMEEMERLMQQEDCELVIDATHPYAAIVSENIQKACEKTGKERIRLLRESEQEWDQSEGCVLVHSVKEAAEYLKQTSGNVLITTGSKELAEYTVIPEFEKRLYPRFLPAPGAVEDALTLGYQQKNMICMQGPFSMEMNRAMLDQIHASWLVTKESGKAGGFEEKLEAARKAGARLLVVGRPVEENGLSMQEVFQLLKERFSIKADFRETPFFSEINPSHKTGFSHETGSLSEINLSYETGLSSEINPSYMNRKRQVTLIGIGMGNLSNMTLEAYQDCQEADAILGAERMLECCRHLKKPMFAAYKQEDLKQYLDEHPEFEKAVILLSGDIGFYSGAKKLMTCLEAEYDVKTRNGISSVVYFCGKLKTSWEDVKLMSLHGKNQNLIAAVSRYQKVFSLIGGKDGVREVCQMLEEYGFGYVKVSVGSRLSYPDESIVTGTAKELAAQEIGGLCVILIENSHAGQFPVTHGIDDEAFIRGKVPMTKNEVRSISLSKLQLKEDSVIYDIGAGTGSISIEAALQAPDGFVYAIEKKEEACALIEENKRKFHTANVQVISGLAPEALENLPVPTHAFIGGSSGNMQAILELLLRKNPEIRVVINCIALESISETLECMKTLPVTDVDMIHVSSARSKELGQYHMMTGMNPIYIVSCTGAGNVNPR